MINLRALIRACRYTAVVAVLGITLTAVCAVSASASTSAFVPPGGGTPRAAVTLLNISGNGKTTVPVYSVTGRATLTASWWYGCRVTGKPGWFSAALIASRPATAFYAVSVDNHGRTLAGPFVRDSGTTVIHAVPRQRLDLEAAVTHDCDWQIVITSP
jgi:hypothetical protein